MRCLICDHNLFLPGKQGEREHQKSHTRFLRCCDELGYTPFMAAERDWLRDLGYEFLQFADLGLQSFGAYLIIRRHFDRSLYGAICHGYHLLHPTIAEYIAMRISYYQDFSTELKNALHALYGQSDGEIAPGFSYWYPQGSEDRRLQWEASRQRNNSKRLS